MPNCEETIFSARRSSLESPNERHWGSRDEEVEELEEDEEEDVEDVGDDELKRRSENAEVWAGGGGVEKHV